VPATVPRKDWRALDLAVWMSAVAVVLTLVLLAAVIGVVSRPLLAQRAPEGAGEQPSEPERAAQADLRAAREAKYREIRDTELDYRTGKLSREDFDAVNGSLRAEAVEILDRLEALEREQAEREQALRRS
jgi:hypothetical protein